MTDRAKEILKQLRDEDNCNVLDYIDEAADLIETLVVTNERLQGELMNLRGKADGWKARALAAESKIERS